MLAAAVLAVPIFRATGLGATVAVSENLEASVELARDVLLHEGVAADEGERHAQFCRVAGEQLDLGGRGRDAADDVVGLVGDVQIAGAVVEGDAAGQVEDYPYSNTLQGSDIVWSEQTINQLFDLGPDHFIPGSKMPMQRITAQEDRADLIAFLKTATGQ